MELSDTPRVLYATEWRDAEIVGVFAGDLYEHGGHPLDVAGLCCDRSQAFISGAHHYLEHAQLVFDRYHLTAKLTDAVDAVRKTEAGKRGELTGSKYTWLKRPEHLSATQTEQLAWLTRPSTNLATARAWRWRWDFDGFYQQPPALAEAYLQRWCRGAMRSRLQPIKDFVSMVPRHWDGIVDWPRSKTSTGVLEGTNSLIQAAKRKARGYRNPQRMITIIYLIGGRLPRPATHFT
jgi:transposase